MRKISWIYGAPGPAGYPRPCTTGGPRPAGAYGFPRPVGGAGPGPPRPTGGAGPDLPRPIYGGKGGYPLPYGAAGALGMPRP